MTIVIVPKWALAYICAYVMLRGGLRVVMLGRVIVLLSVVNDGTVHTCLVVLYVVMVMVLTGNLDVCRRVSLF